MPRNLTSERAVAFQLPDWLTNACTGNCNQGRMCDCNVPEQPSARSWFWSDAAIALIGVVGIAVMVLL
jgi:hypothetical protein